MCAEAAVLPLQEDDSYLVLLSRGVDGERPLLLRALPQPVPSKGRFLLARVLSRDEIVQRRPCMHIHAAEYGEFNIQVSRLIAQIEPTRLHGSVTV